MVATRLDRRLAARDLDALPHEWDTRYELIGGVLHMSRRPSHQHQQVLARLMIRVGAAALARGADAVQEPGIVWEEDGEDNVSPDLVVSFGPLPPAGEKLRRCPELVIEVLSPGEENRRRDAEAKRELYWRRGAVEYWIVDPEERVIIRMTRGASAWEERVLEERDRVTTPLLADWEGLVVGELFD